MSNDILVEDDLVLDPDALQELSTRSPEALSENSLKGARFRLVKLAAEQRDVGGDSCLAVALQAEFQAPPGGRFTDADVEIVLKSPAQARFGDVAPTDVRARTEVQHEVTRSGKLQASPSDISAELNAGTTRTFTTYTCHVKGIGIGGTMATWRLEEDPVTRAGFGANNPLFVTIMGTLPVEATVQMRCALRSPGLRGVGEDVLEFILGSSLSPGEVRKVTFDAPSEPPAKSWFGWLG